MTETADPRVIEIDQFYPHPPQRVWRALTTPMPSVGFSGEIACGVIDAVEAKQLAISWADARSDQHHHGHRLGSDRRPARRRARRLAFPTQRPGRYPVGDGFALGPVGDRIGHQPPPIALLANAPAGQPALDDLVQLQAVGVIAPRAVRLAREEHGQVNQHGDRRTHNSKRVADRLPVVSDRREVAHQSIIRSNRFGSRSLGSGILRRYW
jgi:hypothetical protein